MNKNVKHGRISRNSKISDSQRVLRFLEELGWLFDSYRNINITNAISIFTSMATENHGQSTLIDEAVGHFRSPNPNKHFLVGVLPRLLSSADVFSSNDEIAQFAQSALNIKIPRYHKKSRFELIGHIVCAVEGLDESGLDLLVKAFSVIVKDESKYVKMIEKKNKKFEWNQIIQELSEMDINS